MSLPKIIVIIIIAVLGILPHEAQAQRDRSSARGTGSSLCSTEDPKVVVKLKTAQTKYYKNYSAQTINQIHNNAGGGTILGLAGGPLEVDLQGQYEIRTRNGKSCVQLSAIEFVLWAKPAVIIASNFQKGSCEYREVLAHEQKHIRTTRKFIREYAPKLKKEVKRIINTSKKHAVVAEDRIEIARKQIQKPITERIFSFQNKMISVLQKRQIAIDTPEEYARVARQCDNWGKKLARN